MTKDEPVYIKVEMIDNDTIGFTPQVFVEGELVDTDIVDKESPCGINAIYAHLLVGALSNDETLGKYMEQLLIDFAKHAKGQANE